MTQLNAQIVAALKKAKVDVVTEYEAVERLPTGSLALDLALGGGLPVGRFTTLSGWESYGKSTLAQFIAAETVRRGGYVCYVDTEHSFDPHWADNIGIDKSMFALIQPESGEKALDDVTKLIDANIFKLIIWDSVAATPWDFVVNADAGDTIIGKHAIKWGQWFVRNTAAIKKTKTAVLMINQIREKVGVMFGSPEYEPGGMAFKFYPSVRIRMLSPKPLEEKGETVDGKAKKKRVGTQFNITIKKNKTAPSGREASINVLMTNNFFGIDPFKDLVSVGKKLNVFTNEDGAATTSGKWHFEGVALGVGEANVVLELAKPENAELCMRIEERVRRLMGSAHIEGDNSGEDND